MSILFGKVPFVWTIFDDIDEEEQEDFSVEEIRCCNCFFDKVLFFIEKNNYKINFRKIIRKILLCTEKFKTCRCFHVFFQNNYFLL